MRGKKIPGTAKTPEIVLHPDGVIRIKGRWMMENSDNFSRVLSDWYDANASSLSDIKIVDVTLEYFSSLNLVILVSLLRKLLCIKLIQRELIINWYYEEGDEDILDMGEYISSIIGTPFNFVKVSDIKYHVGYLKVRV